MSGPFYLPDFDPTAGDGPPKVTSFTGSSGNQSGSSLQVEKGTPVTLKWDITGRVSALVLEGSSTVLEPTARSVEVTPDADVDYSLDVVGPLGATRSQTPVHVAVHGAGEQVSSHLALTPEETGKHVVESGQDIVCDPPVRLFAQYDERWTKYQLGGGDGQANITWRKDGCSPSCAAMVLRWFAEDCKQGSFPALPDTKLPKEAYGQKMGQAFWPDGFPYYNRGAHKERPGNPDGKVSLMGKEGVIDFPDIFDLAAYWIKNGPVPKGTEKERQTAVNGSAYNVADLPPGSELRMMVIRGLLRHGPCMLGIGTPANHFVVAQGIQNNALLIVDPGAVFRQALGGGRGTGKSGGIDSWKGMKGVEFGQRMPSKAQWGSQDPGIELAHDFDYVALSGPALEAFLKGLEHAHSISYGQLAEPKPVEPDKTGLPFLLAGPIVRRAEPERVWFWIATRDEVTGCRPILTRSPLAGKGSFGISVAEPERKTVRLGEHLWVTLVSARPSAGTFPQDVAIGYDLEIESPSGKRKVSEMGLKLNYSAYDQPTFMLPKENRRIAHGSCRRPGAFGADAFVSLDQHIESNASDMKVRPSALILTGDQIYADDVAEPLFKAVHKLAKVVFGYVETLPALPGSFEVAGPVSADDFPAVYKNPDIDKVEDAGKTVKRAIYQKIQKDGPDRVTNRKELTNLFSSPIGFTTDDGEGHMLSFPEYVALYLAVWNEELCSGYGVDDGTEPNLLHYPQAVAAARRVLANTATYMVLDDHEITDDWNLDEQWQLKTRNLAMPKRIIANGLAAAWAFQAWGNDPERYESTFIDVVTSHLDQIRGAGGNPGEASDMFDMYMITTQWSFVAPTSPPVLCFDTRTRRDFPQGETAVLSGPTLWPHIQDLKDRHHLQEKQELVIVLATSFLLTRFAVWGQNHSYGDFKTDPVDRYQGDAELYPDNPGQRTDLIMFLKKLLDPPSLVIFSGDVHHGSVIDGLYVHGSSKDDVYGGKGDWGMRIIQVTSSPIKNVTGHFLDNVPVVDINEGKLGEYVVSEYELMYKTLDDGSTMAMSAFTKDLSGELGRKKFIFENHFCIVDLATGGPVDVLFVGATVENLDQLPDYYRKLYNAQKGGKLATATAQVRRENGPELFRVMNALGKSTPVPRD